MFNFGDPITYGWSEVIGFGLQIIKLMASVATGVALIMIIYGGYNYFLAFGNEERAKKGKQTLIWALAGLAVLILSWLIVETVYVFLVDRGNMQDLLKGLLPPGSSNVGDLLNQ